MQRLLTILFRVGNIIIKCVGNIAPESVCDAQGGIAILYLRLQNADGTGVVHLGETNTRALDFARDTVDMFRAPAQLRVNAAVL